LKCGAGWIFPKTKKTELENLVYKANEGSLSAKPPKIYRDQREPERKVDSGYFLKKDELKDSSFSGEISDILRVLNKLEDDMDQIKNQIKWAKNILISKTKTEEKVVCEKEEYQEVEEVVEEEEINQPIKRLLKR
jgi:hypothetical protein